MWSLITAIAGLDFFVVGCGAVHELDDVSWPGEVPVPVGENPVCNPGSGMSDIGLELTTADNLYEGYG